jgi:hypothetical protein
LASRAFRRVAKPRSRKHGREGRDLAVHLYTDVSNWKFAPPTGTSTPTGSQTPKTVELAGRLMLGLTAVSARAEYSRELMNVPRDGMRTGCKECN